MIQTAELPTSTCSSNFFCSVWMTFGIYMIDVNSELRPPCAQFEMEMDWETLIQSKDKPIPYQILFLIILCIMFVLVIAVEIRRKRISIVMPLNQPRDMANIYLPCWLFYDHLVASLHHQKKIVIFLMTQ